MDVKLDAPAGAHGEVRKRAVSVMLGTLALVIMLVGRAISPLVPGPITLAPPVSVRLHGDFNTNNIVYDAGGDHVHFIDVHRSGPGDYLQDIGVFVVSNLRTPIQAARIQADVARVNDLVVGFAAEFARGIGDRHFGARLPLAQARSFITSARVVADVELARDLYLRGVRLLDQCAQAAA